LKKPNFESTVSVDETLSNDWKIKCTKLDWIWAWSIKNQIKPLKNNNISTGRWLKKGFLISFEILFQNKTKKGKTNYFQCLKNCQDYIILEPTFTCRKISNLFKKRKEKKLLPQEPHNRILIKWLNTIFSTKLISVFKRRYNWRLDFLSNSYFFDTYSIEKFWDQASGDPHQRVKCENGGKIWSWFDHFGFPKVRSQNLSMEHVSKKYEFDRKSNLQVYRLLKTKISLVNRMAFSCYSKILLWAYKHNSFLTFYAEYCSIHFKS